MHVCTLCTHAHVRVSYMEIQVQDIEEVAVGVIRLMNAVFILVPVIVMMFYLTWRVTIFVLAVSVLLHVVGTHRAVPRVREATEVYNNAEAVFHDKCHHRP